MARNLTTYVREQEAKWLFLLNSTKNDEDKTIISLIGAVWSYASKQLTKTHIRPSRLLSRPPEVPRYVD